MFCCCYCGGVFFFHFLSQSYYFLSDRLLLITCIKIFLSIISLRGLKNCYVAPPCPSDCYHKLFHRLVFGFLLLFLVFLLHLNTSLQNWDYKAERCFPHAFTICWLPTCIEGSSNNHKKVAKKCIGTTYRLQITSPFFLGS